MEAKSEYITVNPGPSGPSFRVLSYNVLADCYTRPAYFPYVKPANLPFAARCVRVVEELKKTNADIICLQVRSASNC